MYLLQVHTPIDRDESPADGRDARRFSMPTEPPSGVRRGFPSHRRSAKLSACLCVLLTLAAACGDSRAADELQAPSANLDWKAGAASVVITPEHYMWMSGYGGRTEPAHGKIIDLQAKALVLEDADKNRAVMISLDLVGIDRILAASIAQRLHEKHGFDRSQIVFCTSHTHTGPVVGMNLGPLHYLQIDERQRKLADDYAVVLQDKVVQVVGAAIEKLAPSRLAWGNGSASFAVNRRNNREADVPQLRREAKLVGPSDHDVPVLAVFGADGKLTTVVFGYACHATVLSLNEWSGDYPGFAQIELERNHPGCIAMFWAGCGGDQNPIPRRTVELARHYGQRLAAAVDSVLLTTQLSPVASHLDARYGEVAAPFDRLPTREELQVAAKSTDRYTLARARMLLDQIDSGRPLEPTYPYPISVWRIGDEVEFIALGGEVTVEYAIRLKAERRGIRTWVAGYSNDVMAYIPSRRVLNEGGYEGGGAMVYYGQPTLWGPEIEETIIRAVHQQGGKVETPSSDSVDADSGEKAARQ